MKIKYIIGVVVCVFMHAQAMEQTQVAQRKAVDKTPPYANLIYARCVELYCNALTDNNQQTIEALTPFVETVDEEGNTVLHQALLAGKWELSSKLIDMFKLINVQNEQGVTALMLAAQSGRLDLVAALIARKALIDRCYSEGKSTLAYFPEVISSIVQAFMLASK